MPGSNERPELRVLGIPAPIFLFAVGSWLGGSLLFASAPQWAGLLTLPSSGELFSLRQLSGLLTHPLLSAGLVPTAWTVALLLASSRLISRDLGARDQGVVLVVGVVAGGSTFAATMSGAHFLGLGFAAWGFAGAAAVFGAIRWRQIGWGWRIFAVLLAAALIPFDGLSNRLLLAQLVAGLGGGLVVVGALWFRRHAGRTA